MIELVDLFGGYGGEAVVKGVTTRFLPGALNVVVGPNGCGKSTLARMAAGLWPAETGQVLLGGQNISALKPQQLAKQVAYLPQSRNAYTITVKNLVLHGRFPHLGYPRRYRTQDVQMANEAMRQMGVEHLASHSMDTLSGGERQKVYIAMMLAQGGDVVFMDEPTTYLDIGHQLEVMRIAKTLTEMGKTLVVILHDLNLAMRCAGRLFVMQSGRICCEGSSEEVFSAGVLNEVFGVKSGRVETQDAGIQYFFT